MCKKIVRNDYHLQPPIKQIIHGLFDGASI